MENLISEYIEETKKLKMAVLSLALRGELGCPIMSSRVKFLMKNPLRFLGFGVECAAITPYFSTGFLFSLNTISAVNAARKHKIEVEDYIRVGRFYESSSLFSISCDYCSLINGTLEIMLLGFDVDDVSKILSIDNKHFRLVYNGLKMLRYFPGSVVFMSPRPTEQEVSAFLNKNCPKSQNDKRVREFAYAVLDLHGIVARIESRWCPFEYIRTVAYERKYWKTELQPVVDAIVKNGRVDCTECVKIANDSVQPKNNFKLYERLFNLLYRIAEGETNDVR